MEYIIYYDRCLFFLNIGFLVVGFIDLVKEDVVFFCLIKEWFGGVEFFVVIL